MFSHRKIQMQMFVQIRNFHNLQMICTAGYQEQEQPPLCRLRDERFIRLNSRILILIPEKEDIKTGHPQLG